MKAVIILSISLSSFAVAGELPEIPVNVVQVKSGAFWEEKDIRGHVRFSAFEFGFEHIHHEMVIEWIVDPETARGKAEVKSRVIVTEIPKVWSIGEVRFEKSEETFQIVFDAANSYSPGEEKTFTIQLTDIGEIEVSNSKKIEQVHAADASPAP